MPHTKPFEEVHVDESSQQIQVDSQQTELQQPQTSLEIGPAKEITKEKNKSERQLKEKLKEKLTEKEKSKEKTKKKSNGTSKVSHDPEREKSSEGKKSGEKEKKKRKHHKTQKKRPQTLTHISHKRVKNFISSLPKSGKKNYQDEFFPAFTGVLEQIFKGISQDLVIHFEESGQKKVKIDPQVIYNNGIWGNPDFERLTKTIPVGK